ncbi:phosphopantetheine-binding protein [Pseudomonas beijingensis]|uniref:phosphopantetheine-binding protein n=1 Tax=Pseudomonas beijingensis TaxID=2954101 RepID=UPI002736D6F4|nr:phosphopantetheine-binding protein [Pseudomonas sp. FP830]WLI48032.1 phosphopantetheine-binding protein [Pseudomonas sp. FP830]
MIIDALGLEDIGIDDIGDHQTLFGEGLGLDSVDALELGLAIQKKYGIKIDADAKDTRNHFSNVASLAAFVSAKTRSLRPDHANSRRHLQHPA